MKRFALLVVLAAAVAPFALALEIEGGLAVSADTSVPNPLYPSVSARLFHETGGLSVVWDLRFVGDGVYGAFMGNAHGLGDVNIRIEEGGFAYSGGELSVSVGKLPVRDSVDSPYSLFLSGLDRPKLGLSFAWDRGAFFFSDRWVALNYDSVQTMYGGDAVETDAPVWPDRSLVIKSYGFRVGDLRFGFQDSTVMTNKADVANARGPLFDMEYFLNPAPSFFIQYVGISQDGPDEKRNLNDNSLMGFFGEYEGEGWTARAQVLVDDFNLNRFIAPDDYQNPDKLAWMLGGEWESPWGELGFHHAGATKYAFEPYGGGTVDVPTNMMYGYTYYPDTVYAGAEPIPLEDLYAGYLHGENNLAFLATWADELAGFGLGASLEFTISGSKAPTNPWHELANWDEGGQGTKFLEEAVLEKKLVLAGSARRSFGPFAVSLEFEVGGAWNPLALVVLPPEDESWENASPIWKPSSGFSFIGSLTLGARYGFGL